MQPLAEHAKNAAAADDADVIATPCALPQAPGRVAAATEGRTETTPDDAERAATASEGGEAASAGAGGANKRKAAASADSGEENASEEAAEEAPARAPDALAPPVAALPAAGIVASSCAASAQLMCTLCMINPRATIFRPCGHFGCCADCAAWIHHCEDGPLCNACDSHFTHFDVVPPRAATAAEAQRVDSDARVLRETLARMAAEQGRAAAEGATAVAERHAAAAEAARAEAVGRCSALAATAARERAAATVAATTAARETAAAKAWAAAAATASRALAAAGEAEAAAASARAERAAADALRAVPARLAAMDAVSLRSLLSTLEASAARTREALFAEELRAASAEAAKRAAECCVCLTARKSVAFQPCGHVVCCIACAARIAAQTGICPTCRAPVASQLVVWF